MMKTFKIEKYLNDTLDETYTLPVAFISMLTAILPSSAVESLNHSGFKFDELLEANKQGVEYHSSVMVEENGITKRIEIYL